MLGGGQLGEGAAIVRDAAKICPCRQVFRHLQLVSGPFQGADQFVEASQVALLFCVGGAGSGGPTALLAAALLLAGCSGRPLMPTPDLYTYGGKTAFGDLPVWTVAVTFDSGTATFYVDGLPRGISTGVPLPAPRSAPVRVGLRGPRSPPPACETSR